MNKNYHNLRDKNGRFTSGVTSRSRLNTTEKKRTKKVKGNILVGLVLDESGSMNNVTKATQEGYNGYIQELINTDKGNTYLSLVRFKDSNKIITSFENTRLSKDCMIYDYLPEGMTPLYRSILNIIEILDSQYKSEDAVILTIFTDGKNNVQEELLSSVKRLITDRKTISNWMINFIGCGDLIQVQVVADSLGIFVTNTMSYDSNTNDNLKNNFRGISQATTTYTTSYNSNGETKNIGFFQEEKKK